MRLRPWIVTVALALGWTACAMPHGESDELLRQNRGLAAGPWTELWILEREPSTPARPDAPGVTPSALRVEAQVLGRLASVRVVQSFDNDGATPVEMDVALPVPTAAAVTDLIVQIGERRIRAVVRARDDAARLYAAARRQGLTASLVASVDGVYRQRAGIVAPGEPVDVEVSYLHPVPWSDGWCALDLPVACGQRVAVDATVAIEAGVAFDEIEGVGTRWRIERNGPDSAGCELMPPTVPVRRCGLRWRMPSDTPRYALFLSRESVWDGGDPYFMLTAYGAPAEVEWGSLEPYAQHPPAGGTRAAAFVVIGRLRGGVAGAHSPPASWQVRRGERLGRALPRAWARVEIEALAARALERDGAELAALVERMRRTALDHDLACGVTSLLLVAASRD